MPLSGMGAYYNLMAEIKIKGLLMSDEEVTANPQSKLLTMILALLVLQFGAIGFIAYLQLTASNGEEVVEEEVPAYAPELIEVGPLTINLKPDQQGSHILYAKLLLRSDTPETAEFLNTRQSEVHNQLLLVLSDYAVSDITDAQGKRELMDTLARNLNETFAEQVPELMIGKVLIKDFIVQ